MCQDTSGSPKKTMVSAPAKPANVATPGSIDRKGIKILKARGPKFTDVYSLLCYLCSVIQSCFMLFMFSNPELMMDKRRIYCFTV